MKKVNNFLENIFYIFLGALFLLPLERIGSFSYAGINIRISQILIILIFILYIIHGLIQKRLKLKLPKPLILYIFFILICLLSLIGAKEKMRGLIISAYLCFMILIPFVIVSVVDTRNKIDKSIKIILLSAFFFSLFGLFQFAGDMIGIPNSITGLSDRYVKEVLGFPRIQSTFIEPLYFANYLIIPLMLSAFFIIKKGNTRKNTALFVGILLFFLLTIALTVSKGALLSLAILLVGILLFQVRSVFSRENIPYLCFTMIFVIVATWGVASTLQSQPDFDKLYNKAYGIITGGSISEREGAYSVAVEAFQSNPILGIGIGGFGPYFAGYPVIAPDYGWAIANNEYLEVLSETGILGLTVFLLFILSILYYSYRAFKLSNDIYLKNILLALNFALVGVMIQYMTFSTLYIMHIWFLIGLILAIQQIIFERKEVSDV